MEDTLGGFDIERSINRYRSLNPCFNGRYSRRCSGYVTISALIRVLILVLMEDTLGGYEISIKDGSRISLNPCFNGRYSRRI